MDVKKIVLLVGALIVAAITAIGAKSLFTKQAAPQAVAAQVPQGKKILVATRPLPVGTIITADAFRYQPWPAELIQTAYYLEGESAPDSLIGTVVRNAITAGEPVTQGALVKPGERGFLAAALGPGMRAVTIPVTLQSGVAGFIFPGDRVDLVLTQEVAGGGDGPALRAAETILRNIRILATDQNTNPTNADGKVEPKVSQSVTLEVTPKIAEKIALARSLGDITLTLRSIADNSSDLDRAIASGAVSVGDEKNPKSDNAMLASLASRPIETGTTVTTGGDVSRFLRRTVPGKPKTENGGGNVSANGVGGAPEKPKGPVVRIARGNAITEVEIGGK